METEELNPTLYLMPWSIDFGYARLSGRHDQFLQYMEIGDVYQALRDLEMVVAIEMPRGAEWEERMPRKKT